MIEFTAAYWFVVGLVVGIWIATPSKVERESEGNRSDER